MDKVTILHNQIDEAITIMREVAAWGRAQGFCIWPEEWLTKEELLTEEAAPEHFYIGQVDGVNACAFILQDSDSEYWPNAVPGEAVYLHKLCVRREFSHRGMTKLVLEAIKEECLSRGIRYIRLDTGLDEKAVRKIYLNAGCKIVDIIDYENGRSLALYEMEIGL